MVGVEVSSGIDKLGAVDRLIIDLAGTQLEGSGRFA
jgi:hypothetical protein